MKTFTVTDMHNTLLEKIKAESIIQALRLASIPFYAKEKLVMAYQSIWVSYSNSGNYYVIREQQF